MYALEAKKGEVALALLQQGAMTLDASVVDNVCTIATFAMSFCLVRVSSTHARMHGWLLQNGDTALHLAMSNDMVQVVHVIGTKYHESIDVNAQNNVRERGV